MTLIHTYLLFTHIPLPHTQEARRALGIAFAEKTAQTVEGMVHALPHTGGQQDNDQQHHAHYSTTTPPTSTIQHVRARPTTAPPTQHPVPKQPPAPCIYRKTYLALVQGCVSPSSGTITLPIARMPWPGVRGGLFAAAAADGGGGGGGTDGSGGEHDEKPLPLDKKPYPSDKNKPLPARSDYKVLAYCAHSRSTLLAVTIGTGACIGGGLCV